MLSYPDFLLACNGLRVRVLVDRGGEFESRVSCIDRAEPLKKLN